MSVNIIGVYDIPIYDFDKTTRKKVKIPMYKVLIDLGDGNTKYIYADELTTGFDVLEDIKRIMNE